MPSSPKVDGTQPKEVFMKKALWVAIGMLLVFAFAVAPAAEIAPTWPIDDTTERITPSAPIDVYNVQVMHTHYLSREGLPLEVGWTMMTQPELLYANADECTGETQSDVEDGESEFVFTSPDAGRTHTNVAVLNSALVAMTLARNRWRSDSIDV